VDDLDSVGQVEGLQSLVDLVDLVVGLGPWWAELYHDDCNWVSFSLQKD
jgi:hypothetical protein